MKQFWITQSIEYKMNYVNMIVRTSECKTTAYYSKMFARRSSNIIYTKCYLHLHEVVWRKVAKDLAAYEAD